MVSQLQQPGASFITQSVERTSFQPLQGSRATAMQETLKNLCFSAKRALRGQTPETLRAYSFEIDPEKKLIRLRAHFGENPSEDDLEAISFIETEIDADFLDHYEAETDTEVVALGKSLSFLCGGIAYLRKGEPGITCAE